MTNIKILKLEFDCSEFGNLNFEFVLDFELSA